MRLLCSFILVCLLSAPLAAEPPFGGTIFVEPGIITPDDPSTFETLTPTGQAERQMFDRRSGWIEHRPFLFDATFSDGLTIEVQVNTEFENAVNAEGVARKYMYAIGQLPSLLRRDVQTIWLHKGDNPFGGGNDNILIHDGRTASYIARGILEETLFHEAVHTSIDPRFENDPTWLAAQKADAAFISTYARDHPMREDLAESMLLAFALTHHPNRLSDALRETIRTTMPHRVAFFATLLPAQAPLFSTQ